MGPTLQLRCFAAVNPRHFEFLPRIFSKSNSVKEAACLRKLLHADLGRQFFGCSEEELAARDAALASDQAAYARSREKEMTLGPPLGALSC